MQGIGMTEKKMKSSEVKKKPVVRKQEEGELSYDKLVEIENAVLEVIKGIDIQMVTSKRWRDLGVDTVQTGFMQLRRSVMRVEEK